MNLPLITLLTDFGETDGYVAQLQGVILGINPQARIVSISHAVPPQDVRRGAQLLSEVVDAFPVGTIHVAIVDPGVGSDRRIVGVEMGGQRFVAPDNGLLGDVASRYRPDRIHELTDARFRRHPTSSTFHGRDIMAPAAAHWSRGIDLAKFGPERGELVMLPSDSKEPIVLRGPDDPGSARAPLVGQVDWVDRFGNLITNIVCPEPPQARWESLQIELGGRCIVGIDPYYSAQPPGSLMALVGSSGRLEVAINGGNAASELKLRRGAVVRVEIGAS